MTDTRLNGIIRAFEPRKPAFAAWAKLDKQVAIEGYPFLMTAAAQLWGDRPGARAGRVLTP